VTLGAAERRALGEKARRRVIENFSLSLYVSRHLDLYESVLEPRRSVPTQ
jgi:hypothetical protein